MKKDKPITGSVQSKGGRFYAILNLYVEGRRKQKWIYTGFRERDGKRKANEFLQNLLSELNAVRVYPLNDFSSSLEFVSYMRSWLCTKRPILAATSYAGYELMIESRIKNYFEPQNLSLHQVTAVTILDFYRSIYADGLKSNSALKYHRIIKQALKHAVRIGVINRNVMDQVDAPSEGNYIADTYSHTESQELIHCAYGSPMYLPILLGAICGLRRSEVLGLRWDCIGFEHKTLRVERKVVRGNIQGEMKLCDINQLKTKSGRRTLPLIPLVLSALEQEYALQAESNGHNKNPAGYVCLNKKRMPFSPERFSASFTSFLKQHDFRPIRYHDLRHTSANLLAENDVSLQRIQQWLGHSDFRITAKYYAHLDCSVNKESAIMMENLFPMTSQNHVDENGQMQKC